MMNTRKYRKNPKRNLKLEFYILYYRIFYFLNSIFTFFLCLFIKTDYEKEIIPLYFSALKP